MSKDPEFPTNSDDLLKRLTSAYKNRFLVVLVPESCEDGLIQAITVGRPYGTTMKPLFPCLHEEILEWCEENNIEVPFAEYDRQTTRYYLLFDPGTERDAIFFKLRWFN